MAHCGVAWKRDQNATIASCISMSLQVVPSGDAIELGLGLVDTLNPERWKTV